MAKKKNRKSPETPLVTLTAGLAHELRNPLNSAGLQLGALLRAEESSSLSEPARDRVLAAKDEIQRMAELVDDYMSLTEPRLIHPATINLGAAAQNALSKFETAAIELSIPATIPLVFADLNLLTQVFIHLLKNSLDAVADKSEPRVEILAESGTERCGANVQVTVRDNGPGFLADLIEIAFDPFVTSKAAGTGLGLTLVRQVVEAHGGKIWIESTPHGSSVNFTLPVAEGAEEFC